MPEIPAPTTRTSRCSTGVCVEVTRPTLRGAHHLRHCTVHHDARPVVQSAAGARWPEVSPRVRELFRRGAEVALDPKDAWIEELHAASLGGQRMRPVAERSEEHTSELQSRQYIVCRLLLEKKNTDRGCGFF